MCLLACLQFDADFCRNPHSHLGSWFFRPGINPGCRDYIFLSSPVRFFILLLSSSLSSSTPRKGHLQLCQITTASFIEFSLGSNRQSNFSNSSCLDTILTSFSSLLFPSLHYFIQNTIRKAARSGYCDLCICPTSTPSDTTRRSSRVYFALCENLVVVLIPGQTARSS